MGRPVGPADAISAAGVQADVTETALYTLTAAVATGFDSRNILGIGVDVEEIASFDALAYEAHRQFYRRVFTSDEIAYCLTYAAPAEHFAARFAAKEAVVKACGALRTLIPSQVEIVREPSGAPRARVHPGDALEADVELRVSLGHARDLAYAVALALRGPARQSASSDSTSGS
jgi:holo-[acyl-carrier protein] synthase